MDLMQNIRTLIKQAEAVEAQPQLNTESNAAMAGEQLAVNAAALQSGGTVEQQQAESLQKGLATPSAQAMPEDQVLNLQKAAALNELVSEGMDFYEAFEKVAHADSEMQKEAAFHSLVEEGYSFDEAVSLIQSAAQ